MGITQFMEHRWGSRFEVEVPAELWTADALAASACVVRVDDQAIAVEWLDPGRQSFSAVFQARHVRER